MFPTKSDEPTPALQVWRHRVLMIFALIVAGGSIGLVVYGPWLDVESVTIKGTVAIEPQSLRHVTEDILHQRRWQIIPNRNLWLLSSSWLQQRLTSVIQQRLSIEGLDITKSYPHDLTITVHERIPAFRWQSGSQLATVDRHGVIMALSVAEHDKTLPLVIDEAAPVLAVDQRVVKQEVTSAVSEILPLLTARHIAWTNAVIPQPTCPVIAAPEPTTTFPQTTVTNTPAPDTANTNAQVNQNVSGGTEGTTNSPVNTNTAVQQPSCDLGALHASSQEIHVQLDKGPMVYIDRHQNLTQVANALQTVLTQPKATPAKEYIDLRFLPRVYTK